MTHQLKVTLVHNPEAGEGKPSADDLEEILEGAGFQVRYVSSKKDWKKALDKPADIVVAAGGDGTVAKVARELANGDRSMALLPLGTANNIARTLRVLGDARALASAWRLAAKRPLDLGRLALRTDEAPDDKPDADDKPDEERLFVEAVGGGIFAETILRGREVSEPTSIVGPASDRALLLLREIVDAAQPVRWEIELDGQDFSGEYLAVEVMNIIFAGPNVPIAPDADPTDGRLNLVLIAEEHRQSLIDHLTGRLEQAAAPLPETKVIKGERARLHAVDRLSALHCDDDLLDREAIRLEVSVAAGALDIVGADPQAARRP